jgi:hypothetical protein
MRSTRRVPIPAFRARLGTVLVPRTNDRQQGANDAPHTTGGSVVRHNRLERSIAAQIAPPTNSGTTTSGPGRAPTPPCPLVAATQEGPGRRIVESPTR